MLRGDHAGEHEDARADDAADAEHGQVESAEAAFQTRIGIDVDRFGAEQTHVFSLGILLIIAGSWLIDAGVCLVRDPHA